MSEATPEKGSTSLYKTTTSIKNQSSSFSQKLKEIKQLLRQSIGEEKSMEIEAHLDQLQQIYHADLAKDKHPKEEKLNRKTEKLILEVFEGKKIQNDIKIESETRPPRSPDKKVEQKKFVKFQPKKSTNLNQHNLIGLRKTSPTK